MARETRIQRAQSDASASAADRKRGYESRDIDTRWVTLAMALFVLLLFTGLGSAAVTIGLLGGWNSKAPPASPRLVPLPPDAPSLLAEPVPARRKLEAAQRARIDAARMKAAEAALIRRGWPAPGPSPSDEDAANAHAEAQR